MSVVIGKLVNFHGVKGEVKIQSSSDFIRERLEIGNIVTIDGGDFEIESYRQHKNFHMVKFKDFDNINAVEHLKGHDVYQDSDAVEVEYDEGEYHYNNIIGLRAFTMDGREIGMVTRIIATGAKDVWVITGDKEYMVPYVDDFVKVVDLEAGTVSIDPIEGLLE